MLSEKVISYAGSMIAASGSCLSCAFSELIKKNNCPLYKAEDFACHEGGGLAASIKGENVFVGTSGFMHLMGVRVAHSVDAKNTVFCSIGGILAGAFNIEYRAARSVHKALQTLRHGKNEPIFAVRDFNISPLLIKECFNLKGFNFGFPSFAERYRISDQEIASRSSAAAVLARDGLDPLIELAERGKRLYSAARSSVLLSIVSSMIGIVLMFLLFQANAADSATSANLMLFMLAAVIPVWIMSFGLRR
jgi:cation transport ATPase